VRQGRLIGAMVAGLLAHGLGAGAAEAQERRLRVGAGTGIFAIDKGPARATSLGAEVSAAYGITDQFDLMAEVSYAPYQLHIPAPDPCPDPPAPCEVLRYPYTVSQVTGAVGISYVLDVARWSPYGGVLVGGSHLAGGSGALSSIAGARGRENHFDLVAALGLDHRLTDRWLAGLALRYHLAPPGGSTKTTQILLRIEFAWSL
jgi:opacity protein-like surface antigen